MGAHVPVYSSADKGEKIHSGVYKRPKMDQRASDICTIGAAEHDALGRKTNTRRLHSTLVQVLCAE